MIDLGLLVLVLIAAAAGGLVCLRALAALPADEADWLAVGVAAGLGAAGTLGLGLAAAHMLRPLPIALAGLGAVVLGRRDLARALRAVDRGRVRAAWPFLVVCGLLLLAEALPMLAPPVGGDQTKYHLAYPRLYAAAGGLVPTPWCVWSYTQGPQNFLFAIGFALSGEVLARFLSGTFGVLTALGLAALVRRHLGHESGPLAGALFFTLPITWSMMTHAGSDMPVALYAAFAVGAFLDWTASGRAADVRRAGLMAGLAGASKLLGLLVPALLGLALAGLLLHRTLPLGRAAALVVAFGLPVLLAASPCYIRNMVDTGNPLYPYGYQLFGGRYWNGAASDYLAEYYRQYQTTYASRRGGEAYTGLAVTRFPWDLTMHPDSFENAARATLDVSPFALAFAPALLLVRRRANALAVAGIGFAYAGIIATGAWAHPRYVLAGVALVLAATAPAASMLLGRRLATAVVAVTIAGNLALIGRYLGTLWPDQARVAVGRLAPDKFLRRHSSRYAFWERANVAVPPAGRVLVLEKSPHPYYIERPFVLASYLEQGVIDYHHAIDSAAALADAARGLGVTHVAVDVSAFAAAGDPFEAAVGRLWRAFISGECEPVLREGEYGLYALRAARASAPPGEQVDG